MRSDVYCLGAHSRKLGVVLLLRLCELRTQKPAVMSTSWCVGRMHKYKALLLSAAGALMCVRTSWLMGV